MRSRSKKDALKYGMPLFNPVLILEVVGGARRECYHIVLVVLVSQLSVHRTFRIVVVN